MTKNSEAMLFISATTRERMRSGLEDLSPVGEVEIRGRANKLAVWTIWPEGAEGEQAEGAGGKQAEGTEGEPVKGDDETVAVPSSAGKLPPDQPTGSGLLGGG